MQLAPAEGKGKAVLDRVFLGCGWKGKDGNTNIDIDASCVAFSAGKDVDLVYFQKLRSPDGPPQSVVHTGDVLMAEGVNKKDLEDMERIYVWLSKLPAHIDNLVF